MKKILLLVLAVLFMGTAYAQNQVTGTVTSSDDGSPIPYATVLVKGHKSLVANTDLDGKYTIRNVPAGAVLVISYIGFTTREIPVNGRAVVDIVISPDVLALDEVMVVAYGTATKGTYTGAATVVKQKEIKDAPVLSFESALTGKVAGMQITQTSGQAGSSSSIRIRGLGSMNASNEPLYVIDGVPVLSGSTGQMEGYLYTTNNVMSTLNSSDIESITVLKDAAASALYGSRAANGVILITTKKGKEGKPTVNFKASVGITPSWATPNYETASAQENVDMLYMVFHDYRTSNGKTEADANAYALRQLNNKWKQFGYAFATDGTGLYEHVNITSLTDGVINRDNKFMDWDDAYFRTAVYQTYDVSVGGGTDKSRYYSSLAYTKEQGRVYVNEFDRIAGRVNLSQKVGKHVEFNTNVSITKTRKSGYNDTRSTGSNYFFQTRNLLWPFYHPDDYKTGLPWTSRYASLAQNMLYYNNLWENSSHVLKLTAAETVTVNFTDWLSFKTVGSYDRTATKDHIWYSANHFAASSDKGSVTEMSTVYEKMVSSSTINLNKEFGKNTLSVLVGFEAEKNNTDYMRSSGTNLPVSPLHTVATAGVLDASAYYWGDAMASLLSKAEYTYDDRYYASASFRRDGSSRLGEISRWGNFWSVAGAWRISNEAFMKNQEVISNLRLRASYGVNGTLPLSNYGWRSLASYGNKYMTNPGGALSNAADANLSWETSYTYNLALEFALFNNRISGTVEYFNRDSKNLLQDVPISLVTGFYSTLKNVGEINNHGLEIELNGDIIKNNQFRWSVGLNASLIKSTVTKLYDGQDIIWADPTGHDARAYYIYREGESTLAFWGREWAGVDKANGANIWYSNNDKADTQIGGRNVVYDFNDADETIIGTAIPKIHGGISTDFEWKGLTLGMNFIYKIGGKLMDGAERDVADDGYYWNRIRSKWYYDNMWTESNPNGTQPKIRGTDLEDSIERSSRHLYDASFLRLKTISLGYKIPTTFVKKLGLGSARVYFNGSNLLTFAKYKQADPEVNEYGTRGWETPIGKTYTFGLELSF